MQTTTALTWNVVCGFQQSVWGVTAADEMAARAMVFWVKLFIILNGSLRAQLTAQHRTNGQSKLAAGRTATTSSSCARMLWS